jgi:hypothetical protein
MASHRYTQSLSERGTLEADLTVTKLPPRSAADEHDGYLVVATDTVSNLPFELRALPQQLNAAAVAQRLDRAAQAHRHVESLLRRAIADGTPALTDAPVAATVSDVSGALAQINVQARARPRPHSPKPLTGSSPPVARTLPPTPHRHAYAYAYAYLT